MHRTSKKSNKFYFQEEENQLNTRYDNVDLIITKFLLTLKISYSFYFLEVDLKQTSLFSCENNYFDV